MPVPVPTKSDLQRIASELGFEVGDAEAEVFLGIAGATLASYSRLDELQAPRLSPLNDRDKGRAPSARNC